MDKIRIFIFVFARTRVLYRIEEKLGELNCSGLMVTGELDNVSTVEWASFLCSRKPEKLSQAVILDSPLRVRHQENDFDIRHP